MKLKVLMNRFAGAVQSLFGTVRPTKASKQRLEESLVSRSGTFDAAMAAEFTKAITHGSKRVARKNTRGLPLGYSVHEARRARLLRRSMNGRERATEIELQAAEQFFDDLKRCNDARKQGLQFLSPQAGLLKGAGSRKFMRRAVPLWRVLTPMQLIAKIRYKTEMARETKRIPYTKPVANELRPARVTRTRGGVLSARPQPAFSPLGI